MAREPIVPVLPEASVPEVILRSPAAVSACTLVEPAVTDMPPETIVRPVPNVPVVPTYKFAFTETPPAVEILAVLSNVEVDETAVPVFLIIVPADAPASSRPPFVIFCDQATVAPVGGPMITKVDPSLDVPVVITPGWIVTKLTGEVPLVSEYVAAAILKNGLVDAPVPEEVAKVN